MFQRGSIEIIDASLENGDITVSGDAIIYGTYTGNGTITVAANATLTVPAGKTLTMGADAGTDESKIELSTGSTFNILGTLTDNTTSTADAPLVKAANDADASKTVVQVGPNATIPPKGLTNLPMAVDPDAMVEADLGGTVTNDPSFGPQQIVTVNQSLVITNGSTVTIQGKLIVPEGMTITIEAGGKLFLNGVDVTADIDGKVIIEGNIVNADGKEITPAAEFQLEGSGESIVTVDGDVQVDGLFTITSGKVVFNAAANISENGTMFIADANGKVEVSETGALTVCGTVSAATNGNIGLATATIDNYGVVVWDSDKKVADTTKVQINQKIDGATVDIVDYTVYYTASTLKITDAGLKIKDYTVSTEIKNEIIITLSERGGYSNETATGSGVPTVLSTGGIKIVTSAKIVKETVGNTTTTGISTSMDISGTVTSSDNMEDSVGDNQNPTRANIALSGKAFTVSSELTLGSKDSLTLAEKSNLAVTGSIDATAGTFTNKCVAIENDKTVTGITLKDAGTIASMQQIEKTGLVNGAVYETKDTAKKTVYNYATTDAALDVLNENADVKKVTVLGTQELTASNTVPADKTLEIANDATLAIGCVEDHNEVTLTVDAAGKVTTAGTVEVVDGIVLAKDKTKVTATNIKSDVTSYEIDADGKIVRNGWQKWTTLAIALDEANPGDVIVISDDKNVEITSDLTIDEGVTVKVPASAGTFKIMDGVTFTVNGVLETEKDVLAETRFASTAADRFKTAEGSTDSSVILVNGQIKTAVGFKYNVETSETVPSGGWVNISLSAGAPISCAVFEDADGYTVISPLAVALENIADANTDITLYGTIAAGDIVFEANDDGCDALVVADKTKFTATSVKLVGSTLNVNGGAKFNGSVIVGDVTVAFENVQNFTVADNENEMTFGVASIASNADPAKKEESSVTLVSGTLVGKTDLGINDIEFVVGSGATLVAEGASFGTLVIEGTVTVASFADDGVLVATNVTITGGTLSVAAATSTESAGKVDIDKLNAGVKVKDSTGASATVNGPVPVNEQMFVAADATLDEAALNALEGYKSTAMYVGDALWLTIYDKDGTYAFAGLTGTESFDIPVKDAKFDNQWNNEDGDAVTKVSDAAEAYAKIQYDIYDVIIYANEGVNDVFIDGQIMKYSYTAGGYLSMTALPAGVHEITFELDNGFTGEGKLAIVGDGVDKGVTCGVNGLSITLSGTPENWTDSVTTVELQLTGIEKSGFTPDQPDTPAADNGMTITDYLLIILVVLIVVMAIIVAMRLMRS
ncbi:beta strand repeat-containing protein [Candidatus Methanoprimaticola sp. MG2]|uniref:beta strand repeat-containing protein n=1 Tax=Candidatus Methanoprimaticola sp. MG2 TaxID=3228838 RepID=UPI0039C71D2D